MATNLVDDFLVRMKKKIRIFSVWLLVLAFASLFFLFSITTNGKQLHHDTVTSSDDVAVHPYPIMPRANTPDPITRIVFIKTFKTGSTTTAAMFHRFALSRGLDVALPVALDPSTQELPFNTAMVTGRRDAYDMIVNHFVYDRAEMSRVVAGAEYVTIIRDPVAQFESAFGFFNWAQRLDIADGDAISEFLAHPDVYMGRHVKGWTQFRNGQSFQFGLAVADMDDRAAINRTIRRAADGLGLVMLTEYYDESLILLKKLLRWEYSDLIYVKQGVRTERVELADETKTRIREWNAADVALYAHFNRTFWDKVAAYGPAFDDDLATFRGVLSAAQQACIDPEPHRLPRLRDGAPDECRYLDMRCFEFTFMLRARKWSMQRQRVLRFLPFPIGMIFGL